MSLAILIRWAKAVRAGHLTVREQFLKRHKCDLGRILMLDHLDGLTSGSFRARSSMPLPQLSPTSRRSRPAGKFWPANTHILFECPRTEVLGLPLVPGSHRLLSIGLPDDLKSMIDEMTFSVRICRRLLTGLKSLPSAKPSHRDHCADHAPLPVRQAFHKSIHTSVRSSWKLPIPCKARFFLTLFVVVAFTYAHPCKTQSRRLSISVEEHRHSS